MAVDLADAILEQLRASQCAELFGDTWVSNPTQDGQGTGVMKFFGDFAGQAAYPYLVIMQPGGTRDYMTRGPGNYTPFIATGSVNVAIYAAARDQAEELGEQVAAALNDATLSWSRCVNFMMLRAGEPSFVPVTSEGVAVPSVFCRMVPFTFQYQGFIS